MKKNKISLGLAVLSFICNIIVYPFIPNKLPHYNFSNQLDGYSPKWPVFILAALPIFMYFLLYLLSKVDPRNVKNEKLYPIMILLTTISFIILNWMINFSYMGLKLNFISVTNFIIGALFVLMGNFMPQIKTNTVFGIRTTWTLKNEAVWKKTHRIGGYLFVLGGLLTFASGFFSSLIGIIALFTILPVIGVIICLYSYLEYKRIKIEEQK